MKLIEAFGKLQVFFDEKEAGKGLIGYESDIVFRLVRAGKFTYPTKADEWLIHRRNAGWPAPKKMVVEAYNLGYQVKEILTPKGVRRAKELYRIIHQAAKSTSYEETTKWDGMP